LDANAKFVLEPARASKQVIVGRQKHIGTAKLRARQMQSVKRAESELRKVCAAFGGSAPRGNSLVCESQQCGNVMAPVLVWITAYLDLDGRATDPRRLPRPYQAKDALNRLRFLSNSGLALIVGQTVQAAGVEIDSQLQSYSAPCEQDASQSGNPILLE
jgi:hypothetical protein